MGKYLKLLAVFHFNVVIAQLGAFEWSFNSNVNVQSDNKAAPFKRWITTQGRFWDEQYWRDGDFNGDGVDDLARIFRDGRYASIDVYHSDKKAFTLENWASQQGRFWDEQYWLAGDFDGDGVDDLAKVYRDERYVSIDIYRSKGKQFVVEIWASKQGRFWSDQYWRAGDFDGDGADDIARVFRDERMVSIDIYHSDKKGFVLENRVVKEGRFWDEQDWRVGDFNGDGVDDLARIFRDERYVSIDIYGSDNQGFTFKTWISKQGRFGDEQRWRADDFNGDGTDDIARVFRDGRDVSIDLYRSEKDNFVFENWISQQGRFWDNQDWRAGDFNGDGTSDLARAFQDGRYVSIDVYPGE